MGDTATIVPTVLPDNAEDKTVNFISSDTGVATVTPKQGKVTAIAVGTATITGTTTNGKTATCEVNIAEQEG